MFKELRLKVALIFIVFTIGNLSSQTRLSDTESRFFTDNIPASTTVDVVLSGNTNASDSNTLQSQIDITSAAGGGIITINNHTGNAVGQYYLLDVELKSNIHLKIASDVELIARTNGKMFYIGENVFVENVALTNMDTDNTDPNTWVKINLAQGTDFTKNWSFLKIVYASNFKVSGFQIIDNHSRISGITMSADVSGLKTNTPSNGIVKDIIMSVSHVGFGVAQIQAAKTVLFKNLDGTGGVTLRLESGLGSLNQDTLLTLDDVVARDITCRNGDGATVLSPHRLNQGVVDLDRLNAYSSLFAVSIAAGFLDSTGTGTNQGEFDSNSYIGDIYAVGGNFSQVKNKNFNFYDCSTRQAIADRCGKSLKKVNTGGVITLEIEAHTGQSISVIKDIASAASGCTGANSGCYDVTFGGTITKGNSDFVFPSQNTIDNSDKVIVSCSVTQRETCAQPYPVASFTSSNVERFFTFDASTSSDDGSIVEYEWNFGDGTVGYGQTISHTFADYKGHAVSLSIRDNLHSITTLLKVVKSQENEWLGNNSNSWDLASNWSKGTIPVSTDGVLISGNKNVTASGNITMDQLIINAGSSLTVAGNLIPVSTVTVNSGASLIAKNSSTFNITYNRKIETSGKWYLISSPVIGQDIDIFASASGLTSGTTNNRGLSDYTTSSNTWSYYQEGTTTSGTFISGDARAVNLTTSKDIEFSGAMPLNGVSISLNATNLSYNLIGNPYPSFMAGNNAANATSNILQGNTSNLSEATFWLWNSQTETYQPFNQVPSAKFISPAQGFFVKALNTNMFNFTDDMQSHQTSDAFQRTTSIPELKIDVYDNIIHKTTDIYYIDGTTTRFDNGYDSTIFGTSSDEFSVYTVVVNEDDSRKLGIQSLPKSNYEDMVIPLEIKVASEKNISINVNSLNFPSEIKTYLEDKKDNSFTLLENNTNHQISLDNTTSQRFYIHTKTSSVLNTTDLLNDKIKVYTFRNEIKIDGLKNEKSSITIFDVLGKSIFNEIITGNNNNSIKLSNSKPGIYIIHIETENTKIVKKIILE